MIEVLQTLLPGLHSVSQDKVERALRVVGPRFAYPGEINSILMEDNYRPA